MCVSEGNVLIKDLARFSRSRPTYISALFLNFIDDRLHFVEVETHNGCQWQ